MMASDQSRFRMKHLEHHTIQPASEVPLWPNGDCFFKRLFSYALTVFALALHSAHPKGGLIHASGR